MNPARERGSYTTAASQRGYGFASGTRPRGTRGSVDARGRLFLAHCILLCVAFLAPLATCQDVSSSNGAAGPAVVVSDCSQLRDELERNVADRIIVRGVVMCDGQAWGAPVLVTQDVTITGDVGGGDAGSVGWDDSQGLVVASQGAHVRFEDMILLQQNVGLGGFYFSFFDTDDVSKGTFAGVVLGVATCPSSLTNDKGKEEEESGGGARETIFLTATLQGLGENSSRHICNSVLRCGGNENDVDKLQEFMKDERINSLCTLDKPVQGKKEKGSSPMILIIILSASFLIVILLVILAAVFFIRSKKAKLGSRKLSLDLEQETSPEGVSEEEEDVEESCSTRSILHKGPSVRPWTFRMSDVQLADPLGRGSFGKVYKGYWQGTAVAIKTIMHGRSFLEKEGEPFEAYLNRHVSHPNVVQTFLIHTWSMTPSGSTVDVSSSLSDTLPQTSGENPNLSASVLMSTDDVFGSIAKGPAVHDGEVFETWIVLEYCDRGSLAKAIRKGVFMGSNPRRPNMRDVLLTALDVGYAVNYLHSVRIIHGDLKAENVLLKSDSSDPRSFVCKVGDFGLSRFLAEDTHIETFTYGTITHMPPELLKGGVLTPAADMYSFGVLLWELLTGLRPYATKNHGEIVLAVVNEGLRPAIPEFCPPEFKELLQDCWRHSYQERPGFPEVVDRLKYMLEVEQREHRPMDEGNQNIAMQYSNSPRTVDSWVPGFWSVDSEPMEDNIPSRDEQPEFPPNHHHHHHHRGDVIDRNPVLSSADLTSSRGHMEQQMFDYHFDGQRNPCFMMTTQLTKTLDSQTTHSHRVNSSEHLMGYQNNNA